MKSLAALLLAAVLCPAFAQPFPHAQPGFNRPMPPPERRMNWEERQRLREQVRSGNMTRDEARERWRENREQREQRGADPGRREQRESLRRDVQEANRDLRRR